MVLKATEGCERGERRYYVHSLRRKVEKVPILKAAFAGGCLDQQYSSCPKNFSIRGGLD